VWCATFAYTFTLTADRNITAHFLGHAYPVDVRTAGAGSGLITSQPAGISCQVTAGVASGECTGIFRFPTLLTLRFTPSDGSAVGAWSGCSHQGYTCSTQVVTPLTLGVTLLPRPGSLTAARATDALFGRTTLTSAESTYLDAIGNRNGRFDLGDLLALLKRPELESK
jgi:hypothetical protein